MAYTPTIWNENDIITAEKLNNIESGISDLVLDLGEVELTAMDSSLIEGASISFNEEQIQKLSNENLIGVLVTLKIAEITLPKTFLAKVANLVDPDIVSFNANINYDQLSKLNILMNTDLEQRLARIYVESSSIPKIASFDSEEEIDGAEGSLAYRVSSYEEIAIGVPGGYHGRDSEYFLRRIKSTPTASGVDVTIFGTSLIYQEENKTFLKIITCECGSSTYTMSCKTQEITT